MDDRKHSVVIRTFMQTAGYSSYIVWDEWDKSLMKGMNERREGCSQELGIRVKPSCSVTDMCKSTCRDLIQPDLDLVQEYVFKNFFQRFIFRFRGS